MLSGGCACAQESFALRGATIHPVSGPDIASGTIIVEKGRIAAIGEKVMVPKGMKVVEARGMHVYPGMIDCATTMGLSEVSSVRETNDTNEIGEFVPQVRALVAVNPESEHFAVARVNGLTSVVTLPATLGGGGGGGAAAGGPPESLIRGQAAMIHIDGWTWEEMAVAPSAGMLLRFPRMVTAGFGEGGRTVVPAAEARRRYDEEVRKIDEFFERARRYQKAKQAGNFNADTQLDAMIPVLEGKVPLLIPAQRERTIREAIAFADRQKVRIILYDVRKPGDTLADIAKRKIPVVVGQPTELPLDQDDPYDSQFTLPAQLHKAGIQFAFGTYNNSFSRNLPYEAGFAVAYGLPVEAAWKALTIDAAEMFGASSRTGSLQEGKSADFFVTDGDPFEVRTQVKMLFIGGKNVPLENKQTRLYQKYLNRP